jgi:hypothetical protein
MKILLIFLLFNSKVSASGMHDNQQKIDSFSYHYKIVDSIFIRNPYDTSSVYRMSIKYMERLTGMKAHADGNYLGWMPLTKGDLLRWRDWFEKRHGLHSS